MNKKVFVVIAVIVLTTLACGLFAGEDGEEAPAEITPTKTQEVAGAMEQTEMPPDVEPTEGADTPIATETPRKSEKDIPIATKQPGVDIKPTQVVQPQVPSDELPKYYEELYYPFEVAQYRGGVDITVSDLRIFHFKDSITHDIIGVIKNTGTVNLYNIVVYYIALDEDGVEIFSGFLNTGHVDFPVGSNNYFSGSTRGGGLPEETKSLYFFFDGMERWEGTSNTQNFEILSIEGRDDVDIVYGDIYWFTVSFRNDNENNVRYITVYAILYDKNNRIIGHGHSLRENWSEGGDYPGDKELPPGEIGEITFRCIRIFGTVDHYELVVEGSQVFEY
jgi:hypothetical protein